MKLDEGESVAVIFLAAGYGSRIGKDLRTDPQFSHLSSTPKPLLPISGKPLISHWLPQIFAIPNLTSVTLITNSLHYQLYRKWAESIPKPHGSPKITVLSDSTADNATRLGALHDLQITLSHISRTAAAKPDYPSPTLAIVIAADTLLPGIDFAKDVVSRFTNFKTPSSSSKYALGVVAYKLPDMSDCVRRGMLFVHEEVNHLVSTCLVEKPASVDLAPSQWATAPVYLMRPTIWPLLSKFLSDRINKPLETRDAPGHLLSWLVSTHNPCHVLPVPSRIDIGRLFHYKDALHHYTFNAPSLCGRTSDEPAVGRAYPRIGILGNPSDIYGGRVIAASISTEGYAEVIATPLSKGFEITRNASMELPVSFSSASQFLSSFKAHGARFGAYAVIISAAATFMRKIPLDMRMKMTCRLSYTTTIPPRIGLAGSSALILATFRALARFVGMSLLEIDSGSHVWPELVRDVEREELGIECGLMDRIAQVFHGCVSMNFSTEKWTCHPIPYKYLPQLYIIYYEATTDDKDSEKNGQSSNTSTDIGTGCSGSVHARAKKRIRSMVDPAIDSIVSGLAEGANKLTEALTNAKSKQEAYELMKELPDWMDKNFELRCQLFGVNLVGQANVTLVETARDNGFAAKMSGSGGCAVCVPRPLRIISEEEEGSALKIFKGRGMVFKKVKVIEPIDWKI